MSFSFTQIFHIGAERRETHGEYHHNHLLIQSKKTGKTADSYREKKAQNPQQREGGYNTMKLFRYEQETVVNYNAGEQTTNLYTRDKTVMRKLDTLVADFPDTYKLTEQDKVSKTYSFPKSYVSYRKPRAVSTKQREQARERMRKFNSDKITV